LAAADPGGASLPLAGLPLDYYAAGIGTLCTKNTWDGTGTQARIMGEVDLSGHTHVDSGDFGMLRNGVWLTKEFTTYAGSGNYSAVGGCAFTAVDNGTAPAATCEA